MNGHTWRRHCGECEEGVESSEKRDPEYSSPRRDTTVFIALLVCLLLKSSCATFSPAPRFVKLSVRTDYIKLPEGGYIDEIGELLGVPVGVLATMNTLDTDAFVREGTVLAVPLYNELYPVWRYTESNRRATLTSLKRYERYASSSYLPQTRRLMWPVPGAPPGSPFGPRRGRFHHGVDIPAPRGTPIFAAHAGRVTYAGRQSGYGLLVKISGKEFKSRYAHASRLLVDEGEDVEQGQLIAQVGATGNASGAHLHFEVRITTPQQQTASIDPLLFYTSRWLIAETSRRQEDRYG